MKHVKHEFYSYVSLSFREFKRTTLKVQNTPWNLENEKSYKKIVVITRLLCRNPFGHLFFHTLIAPYVKWQHPWSFHLFVVTTRNSSPLLHNQFMTHQYSSFLSTLIIFFLLFAFIFFHPRNFNFFYSNTKFWK